MFLAFETSNDVVEILQLEKSSVFDMVTNHILHKYSVYSHQKVVGNLDTEIQTLIISLHTSNRRQKSKI